MFGLVLEWTLYPQQVRMFDDLVYLVLALVMEFATILELIEPHLFECQLPRPFL